MVATLPVHGIVLAQHSVYFKLLLTGGTAQAMVEGRTKTMTVEVESEQGGFGWGRSDFGNGYGRRRSIRDRSTESTTQHH